MKKQITGLIIFSTMLILGCAGQIHMKQIMVDPPQAHVGDRVKITVQFTGPKSNVANVTAVVRESPDMVLPLNDDGQNGDEKAGDNIWTITETVPWDAPSATYHIDIMAINEDGNKIRSQEQGTEQSGTVKIVVL